MATFLRRYLLVTGALAAIALAAPLLIIFGFLLGVAPGIALAAAPTAFLYGLLFAIGWKIAKPRLGEYGGALAGAALAVAVGFGAPALLNRDLAREIARLRADDRELAAPARIAGVVRIEQIGSIRIVRPGERRSMPCDALCLAALFTPGVTAVVTAPPPPAVGSKPSRENLTAFYRLARTGAGADDCVGQLPPPDHASGPIRWPEADKALIAWKLALAGGGCVVRAPLEEPVPAPDWTLRYETQWSIALDGPSGLAPTLRYKRLTLADASGPVMRRTEVGGSAIEDGLYVEPTGGKENFHLAWARRSFVEGEFDAAELLKRSTTLELAPKAEPGRTAADIRAALEAALADPATPETASAFALVGAYFDQFSAFPRPAAIQPGDAALVARLIADARVRNLHGLAWATKALGEESDTLRGPMTSRLLASRYPEDREVARSVGHSLSLLPPGAFADQTQDERTLLDDPRRRRWATGLIRRQSDRGAAAAPALARIVSEAYAAPAPRKSYDEPDRFDDAQAAVTALCALGPAASGVLPELVAATESGEGARRLGFDDRLRLTLARLGKPVESFRKPDNVSGTQEAYTNRLRRKLERSQADRCD